MPDLSLCIFLSYPDQTPLPYPRHTPAYIFVKIETASARLSVLCAIVLILLSFSARIPNPYLRYVVIYLYLQMQLIEYLYCRSVPETVYGCASRSSQRQCRLCCQQPLTILILYILSMDLPLVFALLVCCSTHCQRERQCSTESQKNLNSFIYEWISCSSCLIDKISLLFI